MRSQIKFVMHPEDEVEFVREVLAEPETLFVDGPKWESKQPPVLSGVEGGDYLLIWNRAEAPTLSGKHYIRDDEQWWYCENQFLTLQFLRSGRHQSFLTEGRVAVGTDQAQSTVAALVDRRYKRLRRWLKKSYANDVIIWQNTDLPRSATNPGKPDPTLWVGPHAMAWLRDSPARRWVQQFSGQKPSKVRGYLVDLVGCS